MDVRIKIADKKDFFIIKNFIPLFKHYIAEVYNELPGKTPDGDEKIIFRFNSRS